MAHAQLPKLPQKTVFPERSAAGAKSKGRPRNRAFRLRGALPRDAQRERLGVGLQLRTLVILAKTVLPERSAAGAKSKGRPRNRAFRLRGALPRYAQRERLRAGLQLRTLVILAKTVLP